MSNYNPQRLYWKTKAWTKQDQISSNRIEKTFAFPGMLMWAKYRIISLLQNELANVSLECETGMYWHSTILFPKIFMMAPERLHAEIIYIFVKLAPVKTSLYRNWNALSVAVKSIILKIVKHLIFHWFFLWIKMNNISPTNFLLRCNSFVVALVSH